MQQFFSTHRLRLFAVAFAGLLLGASCQTPTPTSNTNNSVQPIRNTNTITNATNTTNANKNANAVVGDWVPDRTGPWDGSIHAVTSADGSTFDSTPVTISSEAGVPNLLRRSDGTLVLTYQYFSLTEESEFDVIAYQTSSDDGDTWSDRQFIQFDDVPGTIETDKQPMDPTLVELPDGRLRLYFTFHDPANAYAALYSATTPDDQLSSTFVVEQTPALALTDAGLLDPAVVYFAGQWHHYTWNGESDHNYHSVSDDGLQFTLQDDITLPMDFLGQVVVTANGLKFYGTGSDGIVSASSVDGYTWTMDDIDYLRGADPGVAELSDGSYLMIYTSLNFNL